MLSIIIPTLNEAQRLLYLLQFLQNNPQIEVIVVDGGSVDNTVAIAQQYANVVLQTEAGRARQMNQGADIAQGNALWFLHADTILPVDAIKTLCKALKHHAWGRFDVTLSGEQPLLKVVSFMINKRSCLTQIATGDQGLFVKRDLFNSVGGFLDIPLMEDIELSSKLKRQAPMYCLPLRLITSSRRWQKNGIIKTIVTMWCLRLAYALGVSPQYLHRIYYKPLKNENL